MRSEKHINKKNKRKKIGEIVLSIVILFSILLGFATGYYGSKVMSFLDNIATDEPDETDILENTRQLEDLQPFSALILGVDVEDGGVSRSDTIVVLTVNPDSKDIKMISIPRDTIVELAEPYYITEKINAAHAYGGAKYAKEIVSDYLGIPIQFYATMDFDGLIELVDAVGGVTVDSDLAFSQGLYRNQGQKVDIIEGEQLLNGDEALAYARMRKTDPRGDFGRQDRQQQVIVAILEKLVSFKTVTNFTNILNAVSPYLETNATPSQMITIAANYMDTVSDIEQLHLEGYADSQYFPHYGLDVYTWQAYEESLIEVQDELKQHLGLDSSFNIEEQDPNDTSFTFQKEDNDNLNN